MPDVVQKAVDQSKQQHARPTVSAILSDGTLLELVYRPEEQQTLFCVGKDGAYRYESSVLDRGKRLVPYSARNNLLRNDVVLFPSEAAPYVSEQALVDDIRAFIHRYVDVSPLFEQIASYYVLFTWVYDAFNELPYLRLRGDTGSGKTRFLLTVGSLCYKPIFASGASTVSPLFRMLDAIRGTLIVDEGDFRFSDEKAEVIKILNNGNARGFPVLRSEATTSREFSPRAFTVFGPKLVATRGYFQDRALESRCLTEEMGPRGLRQDIPLNLTAAYQTESLALRNQLLMFRLQNVGRHHVDPTAVDRSIEPRLAQIFGPLLCVITDAEARAQLQELLRAYHRDLVADRGLDIEAHALDLLRDIETAEPGMSISIQDLTSRLIDRHAEDFGRKITPHWVGYLVRRKLGLKTERRHGSYLIPSTELPKLLRLYDKYGLTEHQEDLGDSGDFTRSVNDGTSASAQRLL